MLGGANFKMKAPIVCQVLDDLMGVIASEERDAYRRPVKRSFADDSREKKRPQAAEAPQTACPTHCRSRGFKVIQTKGV